MFEDNDDDDGWLKKAPPAVSSHRGSRPTRSRHFHICNHASSITSRRSHAIGKKLTFLGDPIASSRANVPNRSNASSLTRSHANSHAASYAIRNLVC